MIEKAAQKHLPAYREQSEKILALETETVETKKEIIKELEI